MLATLAIPQARERLRAHIAWCPAVITECKYTLAKTILRNNLYHTCEATSKTNLGFLATTTTALSSVDEKKIVRLQLRAALRR